MSYLISPCKLLSSSETTKVLANAPTKAEGKGASAILVISGEKGTIGYNSKDPLVRQRFTLAHEIGHYRLHKNESELFVDKDFLIKKFRNTNSTYSAQEYLQEQQANAFAAALLMPEHLLKAELAKEDTYDYNEIDLIQLLAKKFQVSVAAMSFRISNLNLF